MRPHTARPPACRTAHSPLQSQTSHFRRFILLLFYPIWFSHHPFDDPMDDLMASYARDIFWKPCLIHSLPISRLFLKQDGTAYQLKCPCHFAKAPGVLHLLINSFISSKMTRFLTKVWSEGIWITSKLKRGIFFFLVSLFGVHIVLFCSISLFCYHCLQRTKSRLTAERTEACRLRVELHGTQGPASEVWAGDGPINGAHCWRLRNGETPCFKSHAVTN